jgi:hypothetical protein
LDRRAAREIDWAYYHRLNLTVSFKAQTKRVVSLNTEDPRAKTTDGLGIGSSEQEIVGRFPGAICSSTKGERSCTVGGRSSVTIFFVKSGRVYLVASSRS